MTEVEIIQEAKKLTYQSPDWQVIIQLSSIWFTEYGFEGWQPACIGPTDRSTIDHLLELAKSQGNGIIQTLEQAKPPENVYTRLDRFTRPDYMTICQYVREIVAEQCQAHRTCHERLRIYVEICGMNAKYSHTRNLPFDLRPFAIRLENQIRAELEAIPNVQLIPPAKNSPIRVGLSRGEAWFDNRVRDFQRLDIAGHLGNDPRSQDIDNAPKILKPTNTWPQTTQWLCQSICRGGNCTYEPKEDPQKPLIKSGCDLMWDKHSKDIFKAFIDANPDVMFRDRDLNCVKEIEPNHHCHTKKHHAMRGWPIDHAQLCRLPNGNRFIISQTYCEDQLCKTCLDNVATWQKEMPNLKWKSAGKERAWYFPNNANLILIGMQETLDSLNVDYPIPAESRPDGCLRYPDPMPATHEQPD